MGNPEIEFTDPAVDWCDISKQSGVLTMSWVAQGVVGPVRAYVIRPAPSPSHTVTLNGATTGNELIVLPSDWNEGEYTMRVEGQRSNGQTVSAERRFRLRPSGEANVKRYPILSLKSPRGQPKLAHGAVLPVEWQTTSYQGQVRVEVKSTASPASPVVFSEQHAVALLDFNDAISPKTGRTSVAVGSSWAPGWYRLTVSITSRDAARDITSSDDTTFYVSG